MWKVFLFVSSIEVSFLSYYGSSNKFWLRLGLRLPACSFSFSSALCSVLYPSRAHSLRFVFSISISYELTVNSLYFLLYVLYPSSCLLVILWFVALDSLQIPYKQTFQHGCKNWLLYDLIVDSWWKHMRSIHVVWSQTSPLIHLLILWLPPFLYFSVPYHTTPHHASKYSCFFVHYTLCVCLYVVCLYHIHSYFEIYKRVSSEISAFWIRNFCQLMNINIRFSIQLHFNCIIHNVLFV